MEIMVVIFILTTFFGIASTRFRTGGDTDLNNQVRELGVLGRQLRAKARVHDRTYRLVFEFPEGSRPQSEEHPTYSYRVEFSSQRVFLADPNEDAPTSMLTSDPVEQRSSFQSEDEAESRQLPPQMRVARVEIEGYPNPVTEGEAMIHFFPNGRIEESVVHLEWGADANNQPRMTWTVYFRPYTGDPEILPGHVSLSELRVP